MHESLIKWDEPIQDIDVFVRVYNPNYYSIIYGLFYFYVHSKSITIRRRKFGHSSG